MIIDEFIKCIDQRDGLIEENLGGEAGDMLKTPEKREWYNKVVRPLDKKIIRLANRLLRAEYGANTTVCIRIKDVYSNQKLIEFYKDRKAELNSDEVEKI